MRYYSCLSGCHDFRRGMAVRNVFHRVPLLRRAARARARCQSLLLVSLIGTFTPIDVLVADESASNAQRPSQQSSGPASGGSDIYDDPLPEGAQSRLGTSRFRHAHTGVTGVAFEPRGGRVATCGRDGAVKLWSFPNGSLISVGSGRDRPQVFEVRFSHDGKRLIASCERGAAYVFDVPNGDELFRIKHGDSRKRLCSAIFAADGTMVSAGADACVRFWNPLDGKELYSIDIPLNDAHEIEHVALAASANGALVAAGHSSNVVIVDLRRRAIVATIPDAHGTATISLAFSPDGTSLISSGFSTVGGAAEIRVWNAGDGKLLRDLSDEARDLSSCSLALSADGQLLASAHDDRLVLWDFPRGRRLREIADPNASTLLNRGVTLSSDGKWVASISQDSQLRTWTTDEGVLAIGSAQTHTGYVNDVVWFPDSKSVASGSSDGTVRKWDVASMRQTAVLYSGNGVVRQLVLSPDARNLVIAGEQRASQSNALEGVIRVLDVETLRPTRIEVLKGRVTSAAIGGDGTKLAAASGIGRSAGAEAEKDVLISIWDLSSQAPPLEFSGHEREVLGLRFSPDSKMLMSVSEDGSMRRWDVENKRFHSAKRLKEEGGVVMTLIAAAVSPNLELMVAVNRNGGALSIRGTSPGGRKVQLTDPEWNWSDSNVAISPDGQLLAVDAGHQGDGRQRDFAFRIWLVDAVSGERLHDFQVDERPRSLRFGPDSKRLACGTIIGTILVYEVPDAIVRRSR